MHGHRLHSRPLPQLADRLVVDAAGDRWVSQRAAGQEQRRQGTCRQWRAALSLQLLRVRSPNIQNPTMPAPERVILFVLLWKGTSTPAC
jgi:hypothetical protein